ncbi:hypothetical protein Clacol_009951 [Clathrus columnatus]|uniref:HpcH/HpaI aldolase/citrate lyase domain-containing protein n=1 Tax=Clathrus columnatus TaxID=1419009 RepID=A0AAV5ASN4_9AGAM|nr:hypothetical protein Clacol_009951 [Clathrus columnatus]
MLEKSLKLHSDVIIYDLEDSVAPAQKVIARENIVEFLSRDLQNIFESERISVRINSLDTPYFQDDISAILRIPSVQMIVLPKIHSTDDLNRVSKAISQRTRKSSREPVKLVASIESARALWAVGDIAGWKSPDGVATMSALLFAAEDFCADTSIIRTSSREELLYPRSKLALAAKAFDLQAIDMVCINYKDKDVLKQECAEGRRLGYSGKAGNTIPFGPQAIHPDQVDIIQDTFVPTKEELEIERAARIVHQMELSYASNKGAFGLDLSDGKAGKEMIDAPMLKQAEQTLRLAQNAGLQIPNVSQILHILLSNMKMRLISSMEFGVRLRSHGNDCDANECFQVQTPVTGIAVANTLLSPWGRQLVDLEMSLVRFVSDNVLKIMADMVSFILAAASSKSPDALSSPLHSSNGCSFVHSIEMKEWEDADERKEKERLQDLKERDASADPMKEKEKEKKKRVVEDHPSKRSGTVVEAQKRWLLADDTVARLVTLPGLRKRSRQEYLTRRVRFNR